MNHDYAHCADYSNTCPKDCFRAQLTEEAIKKSLTGTFVHFKDTEECKKKGDKE